MRKILIEKEHIDPKKCSFGFPWKHDSICYNFNMPDECVTVDNIETIANSDDVETLVIGCDLNDYSFISNLENLRQLYIYSGANIDSLYFTKKLNCLRQLYIANSHIVSLEPLISMMQQRKRQYDLESDICKRLLMSVEGIYIDSDKKIDVKAIKELDFYITEIIINQRGVKR